jgi:CRP-like cAMP-binding protein
MPSLEDVPDEVVKWLAEVVNEVCFDRGVTIIVEGDRDDRDCYFILEGLTDVAMGGRVMGQTGAGETEGEVALLLNLPRGCTTTVVEPVRALRLRAEIFDRLEEEDPASADALREGVLAHMRRRFSKP